MTHLWYRLGECLDTRTCACWQSKNMFLLKSRSRHSYTTIYETSLLSWIFWSSPLLVFSPWPSLTRATFERQRRGKKKLCFFNHILIFSSHAWLASRVFPFIKEENQTHYSIPNVTVLLIYTFISPFLMAYSKFPSQERSFWTIGERRLLKNCTLQHQFSSSSFMIAHYSWIMS